MEMKENLNNLLDVAKQAITEAEADYNKIETIEKNRREKIQCLNKIRTGIEAQIRLEEIR